MEDLLQEYQVQYYKISKKIRKLNCELENNNLRTMEYERLKARRDLLLLEEMGSFRRYQSTTPTYAHFVR